MVITWWNAFLAVVDLALASLIVIGGYNVVVGRHLGLPHSELAEFLPRLLLAYGAAHFSLFFLGLFIDLENALNLVALNLAGTSMLTSIISALFQGNLAAEGLLVWVLGFVLGVMAILLGAQMAVRLALLWVLLVLAGPGLACFALPQTIGYGRMWLSLTATTVLVQFFQVVTLALGGMLVTSLGASNVFGVGGTLATLLVCVALLYLVLRIPGIVHRFALRPMMDASRAAPEPPRGRQEWWQMSCRAYWRYCREGQYMNSSGKTLTMLIGGVVIVTLLAGLALSGVAATFAWMAGGGYGSGPVLCQGVTPGMSTSTPAMTRTPDGTPLLA